MNVSPLVKATVQVPIAQLVRLSGPHGYRFEGDTVHLNAAFEILDASAHNPSWALQLWACPVEPISACDLAGHIVAEIELPPLVGLADKDHLYELSTLGWPPAGMGEHVMALALVSGQPGQFKEVHDLAVYPGRQQFIQPRMGGNVAYRLEGASVRISVERVENPREAANRSGTLSLELWALPEAFTGGSFEGHHLAGVEIGSLSGQKAMALESIELAFIPPPVGEWNIVLMLREWTAAGYVTRDFTNFAARYISVPLIEEAPDSVIEVAAPEGEPPASTAEVAAAVGETSVPVIEEPDPIVEKEVEVTIAKAPKKKAPKAPKKKVGKAVAPPPRSVKSQATDSGVSVNTASAEELAAVKGLSRKLADGIIGKRPFASLDELRQVKGLNAKVFARVHSKLKL
jgi:hypothetical protein